MSTWPPGWKDLEECAAPPGVRLLIWGNGPMRFGIIDKLGNWRTSPGGQVRATPRYWRFPPPVPEVRNPPANDP